MNFVVDAVVWLYHWQTLVSGMLALGAALWAGRLLSEQVRQADAFRKDEAVRRHDAARLTLPLTLATIHELVQGAVDEIATQLEMDGPDGFGQAFDAAAGGDSFPSRFTPVSLSDRVSDSLREFVASLSRRSDVRHVAELVASLQIFLARFNGFDLKAAGRKSSLESLLLDAAKLRLLIDKMYNYARFVDESSFAVVGKLNDSEAWDAVRAKAQSLVFMRPTPDIFFPAIEDAIVRHKAHGTSPWNEKFGS